MMDVVEELTAVTGRGACTDAERRAALWLHDDLRRRGYDVYVETVWVRPQWAASLLLHAALGVVASLLATSQELVAASLALAVALSYALELLGLGGGLRRLFVRRATQLVIVEPPRSDGIALLVAASTDAPRSGLLFAERWRRLARRLRPAPPWWIVGSLLAITFAAALRNEGTEGVAIGVVQFVPTLLLLVAAAAALETALSPWTPGAAHNASGAAVALALHEELTERAPQRLRPGIVLAGAGEQAPLALDAHLRAERRRTEDTVVLELGPCAGAPAWSVRHPQLVAAAGDAARTRAVRTGSARRLPTAILQGVGPRGVPERIRTERDGPEAVTQDELDRCYEAALELVDALDSDLERANSTNQS